MGVRYELLLIPIMYQASQGTQECQNSPGSPGSRAQSPLYKRALMARWKRHLHLTSPAHQVLLVRCRLASRGTDFNSLAPTPRTRQSGICFWLSQERAVQHPGSPGKPWCWNLSSGNPWPASNQPLHCLLRMGDDCVCVLVDDNVCMAASGARSWLRASGRVEKPTHSLADGLAWDPILAHPPPVQRRGGCGRRGLEGRQWLS